MEDSSAREPIIPQARRRQKVVSILALVSAGPFCGRADSRGFWLAAFRCASVTYTGPVTTIDKAYDRLIPAIQRAGLITTDETRELYLNWEGPDSPTDEVLVAIGLRQAGTAPAR